MSTIRIPEDIDCAFADGPANTFAICANASAVQLGGGGAGVARQGDFFLRLMFDPTAKVLYASGSATAPYTWVAIGSTSGAPSTSTAGTAFALPVGSSVVTSG